MSVDFYSRMKGVTLMTLCSTSCIASAGLSDYSIFTADPFLSGYYFQVSDSDYMQSLALDIPSDHFAMSPYLFGFDGVPNLDTDAITVIDDLPDDSTYSYQNYDLEWYTYDREADGPFTDWYYWLHNNVDVKRVLVTTSVDHRLRLELPSSTPSVPGIPAPSGIALFALSGLACSRRRR